MLQCSSSSDQKHAVVQRAAKGQDERLPCSQKLHVSDGGSGEERGGLAYITHASASTGTVDACGSRLQQSHGEPRPLLVMETGSSEPVFIVLVLFGTDTMRDTPETVLAHRYTSCVL